MPTVRFTLDDAARHALTALRAQVAAAGSRCRATSPPSRSPPPPRCRTAARDALAAELRLLAIPSIWLATLGTVAGRPDELVLAAVVDAELLAVHAAVHDALAGRVRGPVAAYLPGTWLPHCVLATARPADAFAALHPVHAGAREGHRRRRLTPPCGARAPSPRCASAPHAEVGATPSTPRGRRPARPGAPGGPRAAPRAGRPGGAAPSPPSAPQARRPPSPRRATSGTRTPGSTSHQSAAPTPRRSPWCAPPKPAVPSRRPAPRRTRSCSRRTAPNASRTAASAGHRVGRAANQARASGAPTKSTPMSSTTNARTRSGRPEAATSPCSPPIECPTTTAGPISASSSTTSAASRCVVHGPRGTRPPVPTRVEPDDPAVVGEPPRDRPPRGGPTHEPVQHDDRWSRAAELDHAQLGAVGGPHGGLG